MGRGAVQLEYSVGIQQEVIPRVSVSAAFLHRALGNFWVTDNELVSASDYTFYSATVPTDPCITELRAGHSAASRSEPR